MFFHLNKRSAIGLFLPRMWTVTISILFKAAIN